MAEPERQHKAIAVGGEADPDRVLKQPSSSAIAIRIKPGQTIGEAQALLEGFCDRVLKLVEDPEWEGLELCEHGEESMIAFTHAAVSQRHVAQALAARKAQSN